MHLKKNREQSNTFIIEGEKLLLEALRENTVIMEVFGVENKVNKIVDELTHKGISYYVVNEKTIQSLSGFKTAPGIIAIAVKKNYTLSDLQQSQLLIYLDDIRDPGNVGTIIRIADWFGFGGIICSKNCVDIYNTKVVQATMGSIFRIPMVYGNWDEVRNELSSYSLVATVLGGQDLRSITLPENLILAIGNESRGLSQEMIQDASISVEIPKFGNAESLNAAVATGILSYVIKTNR